jgi:hypothetical protein
MIILMAALIVTAAIGGGLSLYHLTTAETPHETLCAITTAIVFWAYVLFAGLEFADVAFDYTKFPKSAVPLSLSLFAVAALLALFCNMSK